MERRASVSLRRTCSGAVSQRRVAIEVAGLAVWAEALPETKLTDEQVPLSIWTVASALPVEQGTIGPDRPESIGLHLYDKMAPAMRMPRKMIIQRKDQSMSFFFLVSIGFDGARAASGWIDGLGR